MPKKAETGSTTIDLLDYLFGPGERDEHVDAHLVAGWDPDLPCPARTPDRMTLADLALLLDAPVEALRGPKPEEHVWHISVRNAPDDRVLSDAEWAEVAAAMVHAAGIAEHGDEQACRWIAVRHADDHIHIVATLARQDGRHPRVRGDILNMHTAARVFEARWGLTPMSPLDRTARRRPVTGEAEKAVRRGLAETARESLQRTVRQAAALAHGDTDFLDRLRDAGVRVRERRDDDGALVGYSVALPGDRADGGSRPVWFAGSTLAYDLSLPRVRERFTPLVTEADWALAEHRIREASVLLGRAGQDEGAGDVAALGDLLAVAAARSPALVRDRVQAAADAFEQAARAPGARSLEGRARAGWRASTRALEQAPRAARGGGAAVVLTLLLALVEAVEAAAAWHRAQAFRAQAKAASEAAVLLREAAGLTGAPPPGIKPRTGRVVRTPGRGLPGAAPVTGVPVRPRPDPGRPGPSRTR
ncbi:mobilization protein [Streptomyces sp. NBC_01565]|uniref:mobilization protein n=1 Tax=Streptomyces sp. NBC_01565 TaxID=2975881 RepID=UPI0022561E34|nr:mobilization protein [Streptomyces sp. NBC_01565]MCX4547164.1 mobilization protein [Streptomyces sp. NBC_01565]